MTSKNMSVRHKKSLKATGLVAFILAIPVGTFGYFASRLGGMASAGSPMASGALSEGSTSLVDQPVGQILWHDALGEYISQGWFHNKVTVILIPRGTPPQALWEPECRKWADWVKTRLSLKHQSYLHLVWLHGTKTAAPPTPWHDVSLPEETLAEELQQLLGSDSALARQAVLASQTQPADLHPRLHWIIIDDQAHVRSLGNQPLNPDNTLWESVTRQLSRLTFQAYLNDYLKKRTFFGTKRA